MKKEFLTALDHRDKAFTESYNKIFNSKWYPDFFVKDNFVVLYTNTSDFLTDFITNAVSWSHDTFIYLKAYDFNEASGFKCYSLSLTDIECIKKTDLFKASQYSLDEGFVIFGDKAQWAIYVGEDLYDHGKNARFEDFSFIFCNTVSSEIVIEFFKNKYANSVMIKEEYKSRHFNIPDSEEKILQFII